MVVPVIMPSLRVLPLAEPPSGQSQSLNRNIPQPPTNRSPSIGIYGSHQAAQRGVTHRPTATSNDGAKLF
eukprot:7660679-Pyramimonas_sp.AAC.1